MNFRTLIFLFGFSVICSLNYRCSSANKKISNEVSLQFYVLLNDYEHYQDFNITCLDSSFSLQDSIKRNQIVNLNSSIKWKSEIASFSEFRTICFEHQNDDKIARYRVTEFTFKDTLLSGEIYKEYVLHDDKFIDESPTIFKSFLSGNKFIIISKYSTEDKTFFNTLIADLKRDYKILK